MFNYLLSFLNSNRIIEYQPRYDHTSNGSYSSLGAEQALRKTCITRLQLLNIDRDNQNMIPTKAKYWHNNRHEISRHANHRPLIVSPHTKITIPQKYRTPDSFLQALQSQHSLALQMGCWDATKQIITLLLNVRFGGIPVHESYRWKINYQTDWRSVNKP